jgi:ribosome-binding protein aMBF1 (putative translation factor)
MRQQEVAVDKAKQKKLEAAGWRVGTAQDFLGLSPEEAAFVEVKLALSDTLRARRTQQGLSQAELARRLGSSQSRVAKMEAADASVSVDLLLRGLIASGASKREIGNAIGRTPSRRPRTGKTRGNAA